MTITNDHENQIRIGVIADIQYADKPDQIAKGRTDIRNYSKCLQKTAYAIDKINQFNPNVFLQLGDIVDGNETIEKSRQDLDAVQTILSKLNSPILNVIGNHCLSVGFNYLCHQSSSKPYYTYIPSQKWTMIILDTVEVSLDNDTNPEMKQIAQEYLSVNPNLPNSKPWNGTISNIQFKWLQNQLTLAKENNSYVIVCGHLPLVKEAAISDLVMWNSHQVLEMFQQFSTTVKAYFAGHHHDGGYAYHEGIHHVTFQGLIDSQVDQGAFGLVTLSDSSIHIDGHGATTSRSLTW